MTRPFVGLFVKWEVGKAQRFKMNSRQDDLYLQMLPLLLSSCMRLANPTITLGRSRHTFRKLPWSTPSFP